MEDDLDDLCRELKEKNKNNSDPTEQSVIEDEVIEKSNDREEQSLNP